MVRLVVGRRILCLVINLKIKTIPQNKKAYANTSSNTSSQISPQTQTN